VAAAVVACATGCSEAGPAGEPTADGHWRRLPVAKGAVGEGHSSLEAVRVKGQAVFIAGASYDADTARALSLDISTSRWSGPVAAPLRWRVGQTAVAAGQEALVWGGASNTGSLRDGAAYRPARRHWRTLPPAPVRGRAFHSAVWTGSEMVVWGGKGTRGRPLSDGAAYRPAVRRWRGLARAPLRARSRHVAVWTGRQMLVWGGQLNRGAEERGVFASDGAAYVPESNRWRPITQAPIRSTADTVAVWTGTTMLVWTGKAGAEYDPDADRWRLMPRAPLESRRGHTAVWVGHRVIVWGGVKGGEPFLGDGAEYDPAARVWTPLPQSPLRPRDRHAAVAIRGGMVLWGGCCRGSRQHDDGALYAATRPRPDCRSGTVSRSCKRALSSTPVCTAARRLLYRRAATRGPSRVKQDRPMPPASRQAAGEPG
jgi:kelch motif-containing protein